MEISCEFVIFNFADRGILEFGLVGKASHLELVGPILIVTHDSQITQGLYYNSIDRAMGP